MALKALASRRQITLHDLIERIDGDRQTNLSRALRLYVLEDVQQCLSAIDRAEPAEENRQGAKIPRQRNFFG